MTLLDQVTKQIQPATIPDSDLAPTFVINSQEKEKPQFQALLSYFVDNKTRKQVKLEVDGQYQGIITRESMLDFTATLERSAGSADHLFLPGDPVFKFVRAKCSATDCGKEWIVASKQRALTIECDDHPDSEIIIT